MGVGPYSVVQYCPQLTISSCVGVNPTMIVDLKEPVCKDWNTLSYPCSNIFEFEIKLFQPRILDSRDGNNDIQEQIHLLKSMESKKVGDKTADKTSSPAWFQHCQWSILHCKIQVKVVRWDKVITKVFPKFRSESKIYRILSWNSFSRRWSWV